MGSRQFIYGTGLAGPSPLKGANHSETLGHRNRWDQTDISAPALHAVTGMSSGTACLLKAKNMPVCRIGAIAWDCLLEKVLTFCQREAQTGFQFPSLSELGRRESGKINGI